ncbi:hypothetical protein C7M84_019664 [Penaeus vannamei]|uniref:Uncharacterized protein n=1 Tax=Penaeus vannamei TaxID=6689 RepID=A0A3R7SII9_PENVA|nr:hypothetical protein C7M84_019664 [Penaeus vannamei]
MGCGEATTTGNGGGVTITSTTMWCVWRWRAVVTVVDVNDVERGAGRLFARVDLLLATHAVVVDSEGVSGRATWCVRVWCNPAGSVTASIWASSSGLCKSARCVNPAAHSRAPDESIRMSVMCEHESLCVRLYWWCECASAVHVPCHMQSWRSSEPAKASCVQLLQFSWARPCAQGTGSGTQGQVNGQQQVVGQTPQVELGVPERGARRGGDQLELLPNVVGERGPLLGPRHVRVQLQHLVGRQPHAVLREETDALDTCSAGPLPQGAPLALPSTTYPAAATEGVSLGLRAGQMGHCNGYGYGAGRTLGTWARNRSATPRWGSWPPHAAEADHMEAKNRYWKLASHVNTGARPPASPDAPVHVHLPLTLYQLPVPYIPLRIPLEAASLWHQSIEEKKGRITFIAHFAFRMRGSAGFTTWRTRGEGGRGFSIQGLARKRNRAQKKKGRNTILE